MSIVYLLLGSNLGNRQEYLYKAAQYIQDNTGSVRELSSVYESPSWGFKHPSAFLNQAIALSTELSPVELLGILKNIELALGRTRPDKGNGYEARTIDIDIIFYDDIIYNDNQLSIPHPQTHNRRFVLLPLQELIPDFIHPVLQKTINQLLDSCKDDGKVEIYDDTQEYIILEDKRDAS
jgi:2-amino-4-hydroxy-6-hydroxymethyldihydropteridine diphosphokinase